MQYSAGSGHGAQQAQQGGFADWLQDEQPKRDWRKVVVGDGWVVVRHPDLAFTLEMSERFVNDLRIVAG